jgi:hypothetical protein
MGQTGPKTPSATTHSLFTAYLSLSLDDDEHDDGMTVLKPFVNPPSCENPLGIRKSTAHDAHDGDDDELQRFSKGGEALFLEMRDGAMG